MKEPILILGASSSIAKATAHQWARQGHPLFLAGRDLDDIKRISTDIRLRYGTQVEIGPFDAEAFDTHPSFFKIVIEKMHGLHGVLFACGEYGKPPNTIEFQEAKKLIDRNFTGAVSILSQAASYLAKQRQGFIIGISSVAGDRGRQSNFVYGSTKAAFSTYLQGLRNKLHAHHVHVLTVKPGFVDTPMTFGKEGMFLVADPHAIARTIVQALKKKKDIIYAPGFWRGILMILQLIPEKIFKRLQL